MRSSTSGLQHFNATSSAITLNYWFGEDNGQVDGVHVAWGTFRLGFGGWTTTPLRADASGVEVAKALEALPSLGDVTVYETKIGQCLDHRGVQVYKNASRLSTWEVHFDGRCSVSGWDFCPDALGDVPLLTVDTSDLLYDLSE